MPVDITYDKDHLDQIASTVQWWLDYQEMEYKKEGLSIRDDTMITSPTSWPTRKMLENWVKALHGEKI